MTSPAELVRATLGQRASRARRLAATHEAGAQVLAYYAHVADAQAALLDHADDVVSMSADGTLAARLSRDGLSATTARFLVALTRHAPAPLASSLTGLASAGDSAWREALDAAVSVEGSDPAPPDPVRTFVSEALVQPFAEVAARLWAGRGGAAGPRAAPKTEREQRCPCCGDRPVVGLLREQGHGAGRLLVCGRCATEWPAPRMVCPSCAAIDVQALPVFRADTWPAVRIESCEQCRHYLKSIDLTVDGTAVPIVDDLASLPLDLWAAGRGLVRARPNLLRL